MATERTIRVEVAYATPERQWLKALDVAAGTSAGEAVRLSGIPADQPDMDVSRIGIFGEHVHHERTLEDGDRVEIYRPLIADPKEVRRERARRGKAMGRRR